MKKKSLLLIFACLILFINITPMNDQVMYQTLDLHHQLKALGYHDEDLKLLNERLTMNQINRIIEEGILKKHLFPYLEFQYFNFEAFDAYEELRNRYNMTHLHAMNAYNHPYIMTNFYNAMQKAVHLNSHLVLVNKNYYLTPCYVPEDLVFAKDLHLVIASDTHRNYVHIDVYYALKDLFSDAKRQGIYLYLSNGYRSFARQEFLYYQYALDGRNADFFSARPGHSEHQTGLAVDITSQSVNYLLVQEFENTKEGKFLAKNAHKYGFILRYPKNKTYMTGYAFEPWHLRYVGVEAATIIYENNLVFEEYLLKYTEIPTH